MLKLVLFEIRFMKTEVILTSVTKLKGFNSGFGWLKYNLYEFLILSSNIYRFHKRYTLLITFYKAVIVCGTAVAGDRRVNKMYIVNVFEVTVIDYHCLSPLAVHFLWS